MTGDLEERITDWQVVANASELSEALESGVKAIEVAGEVRTPMITLPPGVRLRGLPL